MAQAVTDITDPLKNRVMQRPDKKNHVKIQLGEGPDHDKANNNGEEESQESFQSGWKPQGPTLASRGNWGGCRVRAHAGVS